MGRPFRISHLLRRIGPVLFWLLIWHIASVWVGRGILLASPVETLASLGELVRQYEFWQSIGRSLARVATGFFSALVVGVAFAALAARFAAVRALLEPLVATVKAVPVASFVILVLVWVSSRNLSVIISFLMVFPIVYTNMLKGIQETDRNLLEMAKVFDISLAHRVRFIYCSQALPYFQAACSLSLGMAWKSGIAAEVIGLPEMSIGEHLYEAKVYLDTPDLFAWTLVIICISILFERAFKYLIDLAVHAIEGGARPAIAQRAKSDEGKRGHASEPYDARRTRAPEPYDARRAHAPKPDFAARERAARCNRSARPTAIAFECVSKRFGEHAVFETLHAEFERGTVHFVTGASGAGKTTLLRLMMGLETPDEGRIVGLDGMRKAAVFQEDRLCENLSVAVNLRATQRGLRSEEKRLFLARCAILLDAMGLSDALAQPVRELSGGMKRRVSIARAVLADADVLFFDEPLKGLDSPTESQVMHAILPYLRGKTVFWVTHREDESRYFDSPSFVRVEDLQD